MKEQSLILTSITTLSLLSSGCTEEKRAYASYELYPVRSGELWEMKYEPARTKFAVWSPGAEEVRVMLYRHDTGGHAYQTVKMECNEEGTWQVEVEGDLIGQFYTFNVKVDGKWLGDTPGLNAKAVGINGDRAAIIHPSTTIPEGWENDTRPYLKSFADIVLYEMHHRDFSMADSSGIRNKGKFLALTEHGTLCGGKAATGIDHLKQLGVTHVHLLPSFDFASVNESKPDYNWGYDPKNYNVPEGSYATNPNDPASRIREFRQMVMALHKEGIRVVMDVVYNHTYSTQASNFERTAPGYFYRKKDDGTFCNASGCGNETASERPMMRKFMIESLVYWAKEYHIDGFRFDLMGIHDTQTMNEIRQALDRVDPTIFLYGEGWAAGQPEFNPDSLAMKANAPQMPRIAFFSDELRDGLKGPWTNSKQGAFVTGVAGNEENVKFGIVGAVKHPQVDYTRVTLSSEPWAKQPTQMIGYVTCHDGLCLYDQLKATNRYMKEEKIVALNKLAQTIVLTSQGIPFIHSGEEMMRTKKGDNNSYKSPDAINAIDWNKKLVHEELFNYYCQLIHLRKRHPAFRMENAEQISKHLEFLPVEQKNVIAYQLKKHANGDPWENILVAFNSNANDVKITVPNRRYKIVCRDGMISTAGLGFVYGPEITVPAQSALIMY